MASLIDQKNVVLQIRNGTTIMGHTCLNIYKLDVFKTRNRLENGLANALEGTCLKRSFDHRNPLYSEHTT